MLNAQVAQHTKPSNILKEPWGRARRDAVVPTTCGKGES